MCAGVEEKGDIIAVGGQRWGELSVCVGVCVAWYSSLNPHPPPATPPAHMAVDSSNNHGSGATGPEPH